MNYQSNNILITGGAGFIGLNYIEYLLGQNKPPRIVNLDALTYAAHEASLPKHDHHIFVHGDITDKSLVEKLLRQYDIDTIIHFAAESHVDRSITGPAAFIQTNVVGTFTLLEAARDYWLTEKQLADDQCRFHHISTDEVYGTLEKTDPAFTEETAYAPNSPYSASKAGSDHLVRAYHHTYGLPTTLSNCSNNYGPHQHDEKFIPTIIRSCLNQEKIPVYGDGSNIRDWLYVGDHCSGIARVIEQGKLGENYNIGGINEKTNLEVVEKICELLDEIKPGNKPYRDLISFVKDRPGHDWRYAINNEKISRELNWQPAIDFDAGLRKTINHYVDI
jgi:dTDP-glucose 4,6-dehydratase